ncbi:competence protein CoiA family protein [Hazenella coriacea]|uniref:Competence protein CoiA-like protein n=1 Tax=Hazenella coriacea TaxID=1179467 RepID=A0A4R3L5N5_9BACL|nr:competence protein CoiA family protein [Hazenella coriacea]TCS94959.1 competence protein CoiA-like protein [Hazenella coriacea]
MAKVMIEYALLNDKETLIHIKDAMKNDPHLKYYCDECGGELLVRDGPIKEKHFAHRSGENFHCLTRVNGSGESTVHKYWKQYLAKLKVLEYPEKVLNEEEMKEEIRNISKPVVKSVMEKAVKLDDGKILRPDILFTLEGGSQVALEIAYKNPKSPKYKQIYRKLKLHAVEVHVNRDRIFKMVPLYSLNEEYFFPRKMEKKMKDDKEQADDFLNSIYGVVEKWEHQNHFKPDVPRYVYYLIHINAPLGAKGFLFFTTYKSFLRVEKSYGHLFRIHPSGSLKRVRQKKKMGLY